MKCIFTEQAEAHLAAIAGELASDEPAKALDFIHEIEEYCQDICIFPEAYLLAPEYGEHLRKAPFRQYSVLYTVKADVLYIVQITQAKLDI